MQEKTEMQRHYVMVSSNTIRVVILFLFEFQYELYCPFILTFLMCLHSPEIAMKRISLILLLKKSLNTKNDD